MALTISGTACCFKAASAQSIYAQGNRRLNRTTALAAPPGQDYAVSKGPNRQRGSLSETSLQAAPHKSWTEKDKIVHVLNRLTFGPCPGDVKAVQTIGLENYIDMQLHPENISEAKSVVDFVANSDAIKKTPDDLVLEYGNGAVNAALVEQNIDNKTPEGKTTENKLRNKFYRMVLDDTTRAKLMSAVESPRQLQEVMTEFWFNHFNIYSGKGNDRIWLGAYEEQAIRPFAMGKFRDLLGATCHHAAMLVYLDNSSNSAPKTVGNKSTGLNENYARELMELHTLGVDGGYSQDDVIQLAHILTGLTTAGHDGKTGELRTESNRFGSYFNAKRHDFGDKVLLHQTIRGSGEDEIEQALDLLARQPATAHHICYQLAQYFVCDSPPPSLVNRLTKTFTQSDGDIRTVLKELFHSAEFFDPANASAKFKSPLRYMVSVMRATGARPDDYGRIQQYLKGQGEPIYGCLTPDGYKNVRDAWLNPDALVHRANFAVDFCSGRFKGMDPGPIDAQDLEDTLGLPFSQATLAAVAAAPPKLKPALVLGSPEFMLY